ncbi:histone deacetylase 2 [Senna tora]|uniref:Histone deacetylase 2 n=1 Tax=Senna tora TaxID=362788 RepID=A0A834TXL9_9FABA|nr:histone deacetylase 2 [Senna tora]
MNFIPSIIIDSTANVPRSVIYLLFTVVTVKVSHSLYRYFHRNYRFPSMSSSSANTDEALRRGRILSSNLYFDVPVSKVPLIYSKSYDIAFLGIEKLHPFDSSKWGRICQLLISFGMLDKNCIVEPLEASKDDLLVVHSESYLNSLKNSTNVARIIEVPPVAIFPNCLLECKVLSPFRKQVGGTILAAKLAKERGWAINVGGGFHHCSAQQGGGFCAYADISLCIHFAFVRLNISRVMIIDLDAHQGNGHEMDFANDSQVYILDMYNPGIYPLDFEARRYIDQIVEVKSGTPTEDYLQKLDKALEALGTFKSPGLTPTYKKIDITEGNCLTTVVISCNVMTSTRDKKFEFLLPSNIYLVFLLFIPASADAGSFNNSVAEQQVGSGTMIREINVKSNTLSLYDVSSICVLALL